MSRTTNNRAAVEFRILTASDRYNFDGLLIELFLVCFKLIFPNEHRFVSKARNNKSRDDVIGVITAKWRLCKKYVMNCIVSSVRRCIYVSVCACVCVCVCACLCVLISLSQSQLSYSASSVAVPFVVSDWYVLHMLLSRICLCLEMMRRQSWQWEGGRKRVHARKGIRDDGKDDGINETKNACKNEG